MTAFDAFVALFLAGLLLLWACLVLASLLRGLIAFVSLPDHFNKWRRDESYYYHQWKIEEILTEDRSS